MSSASGEGELRTSRRGLITDSVFLFAISILAALPYVHRLGFYHDDWYFFLSKFLNSPDQSLLGYFRAAYALPEQWTRPVQIFHIAAMYRLFGFDPLGYHVVNAVIIGLTTVAFRLVLHGCRAPLPLGLAAPLIFALLPHASTDRFWMSCAQVYFSLLMFFVSSYALLRARSGQSARWKWLVVAAAGFLLSVLSYELVVPFLVLMPLALPMLRRDSARTRWRLLLAVYASLLVCGILFKAFTTTRLWTVASLPRLFDLNPGEADYGLNIRQALEVNFGVYGIQLPSVAWSSLRSVIAGDRIAALIAVPIFLISIGYMAHRLRRVPEWPLASFWLKCIGGGLVVFASGYGIFLVSTDLQFTAAGVGNRVALAGAVGVALVLTGVIGMFASAVRPDYLRRATLTILVPLVCAMNFFVNQRIASFWIASWQKQQTVLRSIRTTFPSLPLGVTILLDGSCPYQGPAVVFESWWDLAGALQCVYRDPTLKADIVTPRLQILEDGVQTTLYSAFEKHYPYGENLILFNAQDRTVLALRDRATLEQYLLGRNPDRSGGCPPGHEGLGVPIF